MSCLDDETVSAFVLGELLDGLRHGVEAHLAGCAACTTLVAEYGKFFFQTHEPSGKPRAVGEPELAEGAEVSRYRVARRLGSGGAADVYEGWDPKLKRKVAIKLLRPQAAPDLAPAEVEARLLREAEAMARLSHPNVVGVHDAGTFLDRVFIVMELVEGETLGQWLRDGQRDTKAIFDLFLAAGRGLEAAHAAGVIHRDFKPENVLVGRDGRARVTDFGLARAAAVEEEASAGEPVAGGATMLGGTPLYMSPEQHRGEAATGASDQWSFCLALARAIFRRDPFGLPARGTWAAGGTAGAPLLDTSAVGAVLARGLAEDPRRRFANMSALLAALETALAPKRRSRGLRLLAAVVAIALAFGGWLAQRSLGRIRCGNGVTEPGEECDGSGGACTPSCLRCDAGDARFFWSHTGSCYERYDRAASWSQAAAVCAGTGGGLVSFDSAPEAEAVATALLPEGEGKEMESWIGLHRTKDGGFSWSTGGAWADPLPNFWASVDKPPGNDCVFQRRAPAGAVIRIPAVWPTARCDERRGFVCERGPWRRFEATGHAYRMVPFEVRWWDAEPACRRQGGHLATIGDAAENAFVVNTVQLAVWLGGSNQVTAAPFAWTTREPFSFTDFAPGEPDLPTQACIALGVDDLWHDRACGQPHAYLCEVD